MQRYYLYLRFLAVVIAITVSYNTVSGQVTKQNYSSTGEIRQDSLALVAFYHSTNDDNWNNNTNWLSNEPVSTWKGITVSDNRVTEIYLIYKNLSGQIPSEIGYLTDLNELDLYANQLTGSIPLEIGNLSNLNFLYLSENRLSGQIPPEIGNLTRLSYSIDLNNNKLTGSVPEEFNSLVNIDDWINLSNNRLTGLPDLSGLAGIQFDFFVYNNRLTFEDLEPNTDLQINFYTQAKTGTERKIRLGIGDTITFNGEIGGSANQYQ